VHGLGLLAQMEDIGKSLERRELLLFQEISFNTLHSLAA
jgi:hypothetical protein